MNADLDNVVWELRDLSKKLDSVVGAINKVGATVIFMQIFTLLAVVVILKELR